MAKLQPNKLVPYPCKICGGKACICEDDGKWAAHCMECDNCIGRKGFYDPCCDSEYEATIMWNMLNEEK